MEETERVQSKEDLWQGDILQLVDDKSAFTFRLAMIINADCDMQSKKHDGVIAILPIYSFEEYLKKFWLQKFFVARRNEAVNLLQSAVEIEDAHLADLLSWMAEDSATVLKLGAEKIFQSYNLEGKRLGKANEALLKISNSLLGEARGELGLVSLFAPEGEGKAAKYCREQVVEAKKQMGDDHFFITEIKSDASVGYVIRMRRIFTLPAEACFRNFSDLQTSDYSGVSAYRICKLSPHYKFKAAQLFAYQYSRIGLPDEITALSELAIADMAFQLQGKNK